MRLVRRGLTAFSTSTTAGLDAETYRATIFATLRLDRGRTQERAVDSSRICPKCGRSIPEGKITCRCSRPRRYWLHSRETILLLSVVGLVIAFAITGFAARLYHGRRAELARSWFDRGNAEVKAGRAAQGVSDLRTALVYAQHELPPEQQQEYPDFKLAEALSATGNDDEAKAYLLDLWERAPGDSRVNLELARLAAGMGEDADAKRY